MLNADMMAQMTRIDPNVQPNMANGVGRMIKFTPLLINSAIGVFQILDGVREWCATYRRWRWDW